MKLLAVQNGLGLFATDDSGKIVVIDFDTNGAASIEDLDATLANGGWTDPTSEPPEAAVGAAALALGVPASAAPRTLAQSAIAKKGFSVTKGEYGPELFIPIDSRNIVARTEFRLPEIALAEVRANPTATLAAKAILAGGTVDRAGLRAIAACGDYPETQGWARSVLGPDVNEEYDHYGVPEAYAEGDPDDSVVLVAILRNSPDGMVWEMFDPSENMWDDTEAPDDDVEKFPLIRDEIGPVLASMSANPDTFASMPLDEDAIHRLALGVIEWDKVEALFAAAPFIDPQIRSQNASKQTRNSNGKFSPGETKPAQADPLAVDATTPTATAPISDAPVVEDTVVPSGAPDADAADDAVEPPKGRLNGAQTAMESPNARINQYLHGIKRSISAVTAAASGDSSNPLNPPPSIDPVTDSPVPPLFLALVDPSDTQAVTDLIALIPANPQNSEVTAYRREDSVWTMDAAVLQELRGATPPPVVELSAEQVPDVIAQIDAHDAQSPTDDAGVAPLQGPPDASAVPPADATPDAPAVPAPVAASAGERVNFVIHEGSLVAAVAPELPEMKTFEETGLPADLLGRVKMFAEGGLDQNRGNAERLRRYWVHGEGAAKIRWGVPGDFKRCVHHLSKYMGERASGYCQLRHRDSTGFWAGHAPSEQGGRAVHASGITQIPYTTRYTEAQKTAMSSRGQAMSDGSLPIRTEDDIYDAIIASAALPLAERLVARDHIATRAYSIGCPEAVPADWTLVAGISENSGARFVIPLIIPEGRPSGDNRTLAENSLDCRDLPLPLLWQPTTGEAHNGSVIVGRIDHVERTDEGLGNAYGVFDTSEHAQEAERLVRAGMLRGVSADLDEFEAEIVDDSLAVTDGSKVAARKLLINSARLMGVTIVARPAFQGCTIGIHGEDPTPVEVTEMTDALTASADIAEAIPLMPPKEWFSDPKLSKPTHLSVSNEGRVYGHIAAWDVDHIGMAFGTKPPRSASNYAYFRTGDVQTAEGDVIAVGQLTLSGGHASLRSNAAEAVKHYDDTHSAVADLAAGEDQFGIWVSGALRPGVTPEQVRVLRASSPSGDWRPIRNALELVAVCQVNVPGFPVARAMVAGGQVQALVAAGARSLAILQENETDSVDMRLARLEAAETSRLLAMRDSLFESREVGKLSALAASAQSATLRLQAAQAATRIEALVARAAPLATWEEIKHPRDSHGKFRDIVARLDNLLGHEPAAAGAISTLKKAADAQDSGDKQTADRLAEDAAKSLDSVAKAGASVPKASLKNASKASSLVRASLKDERKTPAGHDGVLFSALSSELKALLMQELGRLQDRVDPSDSIRQSLEQFISGKGYRSPAEIAALITKNIKQATTPGLLQ